MTIPFLVFWVLIILCREQLGLKGVLISIAIWAALLICLMKLGISQYIFVGLQSLLDIMLILIIFGGDIRLR